MGPAPLVEVTRRRAPALAPGIGVCTPTGGRRSPLSVAPCGVCSTLNRFLRLRGVFRIVQKRGGLTMGDWAAFAIGVSGLLLIEMLVLRF